MNETYYPTIVRHHFPPFGANIFVGKGHGWHGFAAASGDCVSQHGFCPDILLAGSGTAGEHLDADEDLLRPLRASLEGYEQQGLDDLIAAYPGLLVWNSSRHALQVVDCNGSVVASVPVEPSLISIAAIEQR